MTVNGSLPLASSLRTSIVSDTKALTSQARSRPQYVQEPIAVVGMACRLPGHNNNPIALWDFLKRGGVAHNEAPESRFNLNAHYDGSKKPKTMRSPGGMFLEDVDPQDFDAQFFGISRTDAIAMDPQQRQLLEVTYECLENAGLTLEDLDGAPVGCFVGSYACDYADMQARDPDDRAPSITIGIGRAILSNRISYFLNIKGPSITIDSACSGSLVGIDLACRYLNTGEVDGAIVAGANLYLSPEHNMDGGFMKSAASPSGKCHTFDVKADGYIKAEAVNVVILKRLDDAVRSGDPIRAVIRGSATNSDGRTPGIASPSSEAQASAIRTAYANAGISDLSSTTYVECHGTGTQVGDSLEAEGVSSVFVATRTLDEPLIVGSIKSNIGHSEPAAGISGLLKTILAIENGFIPGNPTFETPNPKIDFQGLKIRASKFGLPWPRNSPRRASVNSFGYGGSNAHVVLEETNAFLGRTDQTHASSFISDNDDFFADTTAKCPFLLVFSANDEKSLREYFRALSKHLANPGVSIKMPDLAYTLSDRRSRHFHRGYVVAQSASLNEAAFVFGKRNVDCPRLGFVFTGQGAQWSQMGKGLVDTFPLAKATLKHLDDVLRALPSPPPWSLLHELVEPRRPETLRLPEFSQPLVTALQLVLLSVLESWDIHPQAVVGHSSGEIAAAFAAGLITREEAIKIAYFRGQAASECKKDSRPAVGMLAVGLSADETLKYLVDSKDLVQIACYNSPSSITLSGDLLQLEKIKSRLTQDRHFARLLQVNLAYHSRFMTDIGERYTELLLENCEAPPKGNNMTTMFSSVSGHKQDQPCDAKYWTSNAVNPVRFEQAVVAMVSGPDAPSCLIEIGPSGALAGPISQIKNAMPSQGTHIQYCAASSRGKDAVSALFDVAGRLFISGASLDVTKVNKQEPEFQEPKPSVIVDLPNYRWNHSMKYWHESESSKDWRFRQFPHHDLLGSKLLGTPWHAPSWKKVLRIEDLPWLTDHRMGHEIVFPAAGYIAMAMEAMYQTSHAIETNHGTKVIGRNCYRLRDVVFPKALVLEADGKEHKIMLTLTPRSGFKNSWHEFKICSLTEGVWSEHSSGLVRLEAVAAGDTPESAKSPLTHTTPGQLWYKAMHDAGYNFGPRFQKQLEVESVSGMRQSRSLVSLIEPDSEYPQSVYPMHPACIDGCMQTSGPSLWKGNRSSVNAVLIPAIIDSVTIIPNTSRPEKGTSLSSCKYVGRGRREETKNYMSEISVYDTDTGSLLLEMSGLRYHKLDTRGDLHTAHSYSQVTWKPDITWLNQENLSGFLSDELSRGTESLGHQSTGKIDQLVDLIAHKKPNLKVMEINMVAGDSTSVWLDRLILAKSPRAALDGFSFVTKDAAALIEAQEKYEAQSDTEFSIFDFTRSDNGFPTPAEVGFDLVIVDYATTPTYVLENVTPKVRKCMGDGGHILFLQHESQGSNSSTHSSVQGISERPVADENLTDCPDADGIHHVLKIPCEYLEPKYKAASLSMSQAKGDCSATSVRQIDVVSFSDEAKASSSIVQGLAEAKWQVVEHSFPFSNLTPGGIFLVMDELFTPLLKNIQSTQWQSLQKLLNGGSKVLWITKGSQFDVSNPDNALIHGLARTVRGEDPSVNFTTLDVGSKSGADTLWATECILQSLLTPPPRHRVESEYVERDSIIYISRLLPDESVNQAEKDDANGPEPGTVSLHEAPGTVRLRCERVGTIESLQFAHVSATDLPLMENCVEVELAAAGLNFKDIAVTMGIVPEDQHLLGLEGAGVVKRVGDSVDSLKVGQRVMVFGKGTFANRIIATTERVYPLPDNISFEAASTMPGVYLIAIYSLFDLANTQKGHRVLIHSASGGVGIASIQLCQYLGAEIFATVGTDEKREFLTKTFGIKPGNIFSSRSTAFAAELMSVTNGEGVDVIINSLTGDLLDESWRCIANGGTMVEIGKKDVLDRNSLAMEPFGRNASYRGFDMSHEHVSETLISRLLSQMMDLLQKGHIKPIAPVKVFPFEDIASAFRFMRGGNHIGKIVISNLQQHEIMIQARPAPRTLSFRSNVSYLIVGGLKGLCGSLAIFLARLGAKNLVVLARSGYSDQRSQAALKNIRAEGCEVDLVKGDVSVLADVQRAFKCAIVPIGGLFQGAMVLRDKIFTSMTAQEYHQTIESKVRGTWNLHNVALEQDVPLTFFTMLSSISGVVGQKGQANYAAGNVFLDSFSAYRHKLGLPACSVDLGAIEDVGYMSEHSDLAAVWDTAAWTPINEGLFHKIIRFSLLQQINPINKASASQLVTGLAVPQKETSFLRADARFGALFFKDTSNMMAADSKKDGSKEIRAFFVMLRSGQTDKAVLLASAVDIINRQLTSSLRLSEPIEPAKTLANYGMDSLAAVEFRNWVRMELGAELTTLEITNATSLFALGDKVIAKIALSVSA